VLTLRTLHGEHDGEGGGEGDGLSGGIDHETIVGLARDLLARAVARRLVDDRFGASWAAEVASRRLVGAMAFDDDHPDRLVGLTAGILSGPSATVALDCLVDAGSMRARQAILSPLIERAIGDARSAGAGRIEIWIKPVRDGDDGVLATLGATPYRSLHQMRCPLPVPVGKAGEPLVTRAFVPGRDDEDLVRVNNRAFASHPVQGTLTVEAFRREMGEPWFRADGVRLYEVDGELAGFCWTKQHDYGPHDEAPLGEIYVICVDPDFHGRGLGRPMTSAGLDWLVEHGSTTGMLYVEADNAPALRTYQRLGFEIVRTDRAWFLPHD
jgi:mycothiol synthase